MSFLLFTILPIVIATESVFHFEMCSGITHTNAAPFQTNTWKRTRARPFYTHTHTYSHSYVLHTYVFMCVLLYKCMCMSEWLDNGRLEICIRSRQWIFLLPAVIIEHAHTSSNDTNQEIVKFVDRWMKLLTNTPITFSNFDDCSFSDSVGNNILVSREVFHLIMSYSI